MKYFILGVFILVFIACKKKKQEEQPVLTAAETGFNYQNNLNEQLLLEKNSGGYDTSFSFSGICLKVYPSTVVPNNFTSTNVNGYVADVNNNFNGKIATCPNFMQLANHSTWNVISPEFGNFQYVDSIPMPIIRGAINIPATFSAAVGIPISISGIENVGSISIDVNTNDYYFLDTYNTIRYFQTTGISAINDTIRNFNFQSIPANTTLTLSVIAYRNWDTMINNHYGKLRKSATYNYFTVKKIN